jgi:DNA-binding NtrC family response regulator
MSTILVAAKRQFGAALLAATLEEGGHQVEWSASLETARLLVAKYTFDAVLVDVSELDTAALDQLAVELDGIPLVSITHSHDHLPPAGYVISRPHATQLLEAIRHATAQPQAAAPATPLPARSAP